MISAQTLQQVGGYLRLLIMLAIAPLLNHFIDNKLVVIVIDVTTTLIVCGWSVWVKLQTVGGVVPVIGGVLRNATANLLSVFVTYGWITQADADQALLAVLGLVGFFWTYEAKMLPTFQLKPKATTKRIM